MITQEQIFNANDYKAALNIFEDESVIRPIFERYSGKVSLLELPKILEELSLIVCVDCTKAFDYFRTPLNSDDKTDVMNPFSFGFFEFRKRIENFFLKEIYLVEGFENGLENFINDFRPSIPVFYNKENIKKSENSSNFQEKTSEINENEVITKANLKNPLVLAIVTSYSSEIFYIFETYANNNKIDIRTTGQIL